MNLYCGFVSLLTAAPPSPLSQRFLEEQHISLKDVTIAWALGDWQRLRVAKRCSELTSLSFKYLHAHRPLTASPPRRLAWSALQNAGNKFALLQLKKCNREENNKKQR